MTAATWIRAADLRKRWGNMAKSTFYLRMQNGQIPKPEHPFGPWTPYWRVATIEEHERKAQVASSAEHGGARETL